MVAPTGDDRIHHENPALHLQALAGFASHVPIPTEKESIVILIERVVPVIDRFIKGEQSREIREELGMQLAQVRDCLRKWSDELEALWPKMTSSPREEELLSRGESPGYIMRSILHAGAHLEAACWGLLPNSPEAEKKRMEWPDVDFSSPQFLERQLLGTLSCLARAKNLCELLQQVKSILRDPV